MNLRTDIRVVIIGVLTVSAVILTVVNERTGGSQEEMSLFSSPKQPITAERVHRMADTTLRALGIRKDQIRPLRNRNDVRVLTPEGFDPLRFVKAMRDSLAEYRAEIISMETGRERNTVVQIKEGATILKSYSFSKDQATAARKGVSSSVPKKQPR